MRYLRSNTAVIVAVGPFIGTDGFTLKTALTITNEKITASADTDDGSAPTLILDNITGATSGTSNDLNYITGQDNAMMQMELSAANVNRLGRFRVTITDATNHLPVIEDFEILDADSYDSMFVASRLKNLLGFTVIASTMLTTGHTTTAGRFASGDGAKAKIGSLIWVPATYDLHRIKTLSTDDWTVDAADAFSTDPQGAVYYIISNPLNLPLTSSDIATSFGQALADRLLARNQLGAADSSPTVSAAIASGLLKLVISGATLTVKHGDGTTAYTRTITRLQADAILSLV